MRILIVHDYGRPVGGAERMSVMLRDRLRERGHDHGVLRLDRRTDRRSADPGRRTCLGSMRLQPILQALQPRRRSPSFARRSASFGRTSFTSACS